MNSGLLKSLGIELSPADVATLQEARRRGVVMKPTEKTPRPSAGKRGSPWGKRKSNEEMEMIALDVLNKSIFTLDDVRDLSRRDRSLTFVRHKVIMALTEKNCSGRNIANFIGCSQGLVDIVRYHAKQEATQ